MESLWTEMAFYVVETQASVASVLATLPVPVTVVREAPRTYALQALIHQGTYGDTNHTSMAAIALEGKVLIAPPGGHWPRTGGTEWLRALSKAFGTVHGFNTSSANTQIVKYEAGLEVATVSEYGPPSTGPILGVSKLVDGEDAPVWAAMEKLLGIEDVKAVLRVGECLLCEAADR
jgi:hypothetical protein